MPASPRSTKHHPAHQYALDVASGKIVTGELVRLAVERHLRDLKEGPKRGLVFDEKAAKRAIQFFGFLRHSKGEWAGQGFTLAPWQQFLLWVLFGWKRADGTRRFRTAYNQIARKNGKSTIAAGIGLFLFFADGEPGAEVYTAATKRDQARIVHSEAVRMVKASPALKARIKCFKDNLSVPKTNSKFEPLGADEDTLDGLNSHGNIVDELHAHKTRKTWDLLETATGARRSPLTFAITTAGYDKHSVCREQYEYAEKVLKGIIEDDSFFAFVAAIDEDDDWRDPKCWVKANPNLGVSVKLDSLIEQCNKAKESPASQNTFRRLRLNQWTEQENRWLDMAVWDENGEPFNPEELLGRRCYGGLDLSKIADLSAHALLFPPEHDAEKWKLLIRFWVPEESILKRSKKDRVPYDVWTKSGLIETTAGNVVDYGFIQAAIIADAQKYDIQEIAYDRMFASEIVHNLMEEGLTMVPFGQGFLSMASPTAEFEKMLIGRQMSHGGNAVLRWMASNVTVKQDPAGNLKPDKEKSSEKIDGIVAAIMGLGRAMLRPSGGSVYEERGILTL